MLVHFRDTCHIQTNVWSPGTKHQAFGKLLLVLYSPWQSARQAMNAQVSLCLTSTLADAAWLALHENPHSGHNVLA